MSKLANRSGCELCQDQIQKDANIDLLWKMFIISLVLLVMVIETHSATFILMVIMLLIMMVIAIVIRCFRYVWGLDRRLDRGLDQSLRCSVWDVLCRFLWRF